MATASDYLKGIVGDLAAALALARSQLDTVAAQLAESQREGERLRDELAARTVDAPTDAA